MSAQRLHKYDPELKLILLNSMAEECLRDQKALGFTGYFTKPLSLKQIELGLKIVASEAATDTLIKKHHVNALEEDKQETLEGIKALIVEDNDMNQLVLEGILEDMGIEAVIANHGADALDLLNETNAEEIDVLLVDCQMPVMDGYITTRNIRSGEAGESHRDSMIIAMTANAMQGEREKCPEAGMNNYLTKPIDSRALRAALVRINPNRGNCSFIRASSYLCCDLIIRVALCAGSCLMHSLESHQ